VRKAGIVALALVGALTVTCAPAGAASGSVLVVGDSLAVGIRPYLDSMLGDRDITWDAKSGRTTPQGLLALRAALLEVTPQTVVISLGTNDGSDPGRFASRLHRVLGAIPPTACVVWPAIIRPPRKGLFADLDRVLRAEARLDRRLVVPGWDRAVARGSVVLPDGVHPDPAGYRYRTQMIVRAIRARCDR
jgi:lysophospholipase L1-like esterase